MAILTERRPFGDTGLSVSPLGFGGAPIGFLETEQDRVGRLLNTLLDEGMNLIDTAAMYRGSERMIRDAVGHRRDQFVLVTKCGTEVPDIDAPAWSAELVSRTVDRALANLGCDTIDVMLLHSCSLEVLEKGEALGALVEARDAGKIRFLGYSGDNETLAHAAQMPDIRIVQTSVNICDQANIDLGITAAREHRVGVMAKRPIANAAWKKLDEQPGMYQSYASEYTRRFAEMGLERESLGLDAPWSEIALRFTLGVEGVSTAIIGTTNPDHARANLEAAAKGPLPAAAQQKLREAFAAAPGSGDWAGQT